MAKSLAARPAKTASQYQLLPVIGPTEGVDLRTSPTLLRPGQARTLVNFSLTEPGALVVRAGWQQFSTSVLSTGRIQGAARVYLNTAIPNPVSTAVTVVGLPGGALRTISDGGVWSSDNLTGLSTNDLDFPADRDLVAVFDGQSTRLWKSTNGSSWTRFGIAAGAVPSTASSKAGGSLLAAEFEFGYTYKDRDLACESNGSTGLSTVTLGSTGAVELQIPNSTDPQVDAIVIYARNKTSGELVRRKASSFAMQSTVANSHSTVTITSSGWATNDEEPSDHDLPPALSFGVVWKNRWWARDATVTNRIHFTQIFQPQSWPALFYLDIPFEHGDGVRALLPMGDSLLIFGANRIFVIIGQTSLDFDVRPTLGSQDGALGFRSVCAIENGVVHAGASGVYIWDGATDRLLSWNIDPAWRDLIGNTAAAELAHVACVYHQPLKELRVAVPRRYPSGADGEWILDLNRTRTTNDPSWTATDRSVGGYILWNGPETHAGNQGRLLTWPSTAVAINEEAIGTSANGSDLTAEYEGPGLSLGPYQGRWTDVRGEYEPHSGVFSVEPVVDGVSQGTQAVSIGAGLSLYGTATYGSGVYAGAGRRQFVIFLPLSGGGGTFVLKGTYTGQDTFRWFSYHAGLRPETASRDFSA